MSRIESITDSVNSRQLTLAVLLGVFLALFMNTAAPVLLDGPSSENTPTNQSTPTPQAAVDADYTNNNISVEVSSLGSSKSIYVVRNATTQPAYYLVRDEDGRSDVGDTITITGVDENETVRIVAMGVGWRKTIRTFNPKSNETTSTPSTPTHTVDATTQKP